MKIDEEKNILLDKRIIQKKILQGEMTEEELREYLKDLPDLADNAEEIRLEQ